jgi:D-serine deaminase-like pyridoxal phosphate-dependent protein
MPLTDAEVASFKLGLLENEPAEYERLFFGEPPCDPLLYPHGILISLDIAKLNPITCKDDVVTVDVLRKLRAMFARLGLPVEVAIEGDELHVRFWHLPGSSARCTADSETDIEIIGLDYRTAMRLDALVGRLLPTLVEKIVIVR